MLKCLGDLRLITHLIRGGTPYRDTSNVRAPNPIFPACFIPGKSFVIISSNLGAAALMGFSSGLTFFFGGGVVRVKGVRCVFV